MPDPLVDINFIELEYPTAREDTMPEKTDFTALERSTYPKRDLYENAEPITDPKEALPLLADPNPFGGRWVSARLYDGTFHDGPRLEIQWAGREFEDGGMTRYRVDPACVEELRRNSWVEGLPKMGYTDEHTLRITNRGYDQLRAWRQEEQAAAETLMRASVPGSGLTYRGECQLRRGASSKDWRYGHAFSTESGDWFMAFLDQRAILKVREDELR